MRIRGHHLLCTLSFEGAGYDDSFAKNMKEICSKLEENSSCELILQKGADDICSCCPNLKNSICATTKDNEKVLNMDKKVIDILALKIGENYEYSFLVEQLQRKLGLKEFEDVCGDCQWYKKGYCSFENIKNKLNHKKQKMK